MNNRNPKISADIALLGNKLLEAEENLNTDKKLSDSLRLSENVVLAMHMGIGQAHGKPDGPLPEYISRNQLEQVKNDPTGNPERSMPLPVADILYPIEMHGTQADSIGALSAHPDKDGSIRAEPLVVDYYNQMYPSLALQLAMRSLNLGPDDVTVNLGEM